MADHPEEQPEFDEYGRPLRDERGILILYPTICFPEAGGWGCGCWGRRPRKRGRECTTETPSVIYLPGPEPAADGHD